MNIDDYLTKIQQQQIVAIIDDRCKRFRSFEKQYNSLFYGPYTVMRHKHTLTSAVLSGFAPNAINIDGMTSKNINYGLQDKLVQPELQVQNAVFQIYSNGSDLKGNLIRKRCQEYNGKNKKDSIFFVIVFYATAQGMLKQIEICFLDDEARITEKQTIYSIPHIETLAG